MSSSKKMFQLRKPHAGTLSGREALLDRLIELDDRLAESGNTIPVSQTRLPEQDRAVETLPVQSSAGRSRGREASWSEFPGPTHEAKRKTFSAVKISVAMCTYNGARYLRGQLDSIAAQTRPPDELVICDDCSSDETLHVVERFADAAVFPVRLMVNQRTLGSTRNFERAAALSTGDVIAFSDQDDLWRADKLSIIEDYFLLNPETGLVFSDAELVDEDLQPLGCSLWERVGFDEQQKQQIKAGHALAVLLPGCTVTGATMAFRSSFRELFLPIPDNLPMIHDGWTALVIAAAAKVAFIEEPLMKYRQHANQQIGAPSNNSIGIGPRLTKLEAIQLSLKRVNSYSPVIGTVRKLQQQLLKKGTNAEFRQALSDLASIMKHFETRADLPENRFNRVPAVVRELLSLRYHRYSKGIFSAAKDLMS